MGAGEILDLRDAPQALEVLTRAEIDVQIVTAKRYPRSPARFLQEAKAMATLDPEIAAGCTYALKRDGKTISGPSVRLAEIVACCWGNLRTTARVVGEDARSVTAQAVCLDLERNVGFSVEAKRRITNRDGRRYGDDMVITTSMAAISIALRNAVFRAVPRAFVDLVHREAKECAAGELESLAVSRQKWVAYFAKKGVPETMVYAAMGVNGAEDIGLDHLILLQGFANAVRDGESTLADIFEPAQQSPIGKTVSRPGETRSAGLATRLMTPADGPAFAPGTSGRIKTEAEDGTSDEPAGD